ncbi:MAG: TRAP transporter substrate-binding protein [Alphaproteobacteria bacterium]|nr:TRAP transporter substrate-binding protein [Alphaproteobacteria bacterium]
MKRMALALVIGLLGTSAVAQAVMAQDRPVDLKISIWLPPAHPLVPSTKEWAADIEKQSGGTIKSAIFPSEQLGKAFDHYDMARDGIADITYVNPGYQPGRFPIIAVGQIPFTFADAKKGTAALDAWYRKLAATEMKDTHFCLAFILDPGTYHGRKKVTVPEDIKGMKIRPAQSTLGQMVTMLGGTNVQASAPEARDVLERGVADGIFFPWGSMFLFGLDKVTKYHMDVPLFSAVFTYSMNKAKYDAMSPAQKKVIDDHCTTEWAVKLTSPWHDFEESGLPKMKAAAGHEVYPLTPDQLKQWKASVEPLQKAWAEAVRKTGADPDALYKDFQASVAKYQAGF